MENVTKISKQEAQEVLEKFTDDISSLMLSTVSSDGMPFVSYAPFVEDEDKNYYICVSGYVPHSKNMNETKKVAIMFIEDEKDAFHPFGRRRLYFDGLAEKFEEDDERNEQIGELFKNKFGNKVGFMFKMPDFRIYKIAPSNGSLVLGFGAAYHVNEDRKTLKAKTAFHEKKHDDTLKEKIEIS